MDKDTTATIVLGLGFGDEAKGMTVGFLAEQMAVRGITPLVVRWNGGPQAAHNVRIRGVHHTFSQFGSGTLSGAKTLLSDGMLVSPFAIMKEAVSLQGIGMDNPLRNLMIDRNAPLLLPLYRELNQQLETLRGNARHGSTGIGIGVARTFENTMKERGLGYKVPVVDDIANPFMLVEKLKVMQEWLSTYYSMDVSKSDRYLQDLALKLYTVYIDMLDAGVKLVGTDNVLYDYRKHQSDIIFEGAQGIMIDQKYGYFPHVTYGNMLPDELIKRCEANGLNRPKIVGCIRTYSTRHGAGPFYAEGTADIPETDNGTGTWQGGFRTGLFDVQALGYAADLVHPDTISLSHEDRYPGSVIIGYEDADGVRIDEKLRPSEGLVVDDVIKCAPIVRKATMESLQDIVNFMTSAGISIHGKGSTLEEWSLSDQLAK